MWSDISAMMMDNTWFQEEEKGYKHEGLLFLDFYNAIQEQADRNPKYISRQLNSAPVLSRPVG